MIIPSAPIAEWQYASSADIVNTTAVEVAPAVASQRNRVTGIDVHNSDTAVGTVVNVLSGSTVIWSCFVNPFVVAAPGQNHVGRNFNQPLVGGVSEAISVQCVTDSAQVRVSLQGIRVQG
jgi:hypothetical protein